MLFHNPVIAAQCDSDQDLVVRLFQHLQRQLRHLARGDFFTDVAQRLIER
jgi:hypothetical protein